MTARYVVVAVVFAGLVSVIVWGQMNQPAPVTTSTTSAAPTATSASPTSTTTPSTTTTAAPTTTSATADSKRLEEVRSILQDLYYGWFDAIYRKDPDALWRVVATPSYHEAGVRAMETLSFVDAPNRQDFEIETIEILLDRPDCLVIYSETYARFLGAGSSGVHVLWPDERGRWRFASKWQYKNDLWLNDCDLMERPSTP